MGVMGGPGHGYDNSRVGERARGPAVHTGELQAIPGAHTGRGGGVILFGMENFHQHPAQGYLAYSTHGLFREHDGI